MRHREIELRNGKITLVDEDDYDMASANEWSQQKIGGYVKRSIRVDGNVTTFLLHRIIMNAVKGVQVDHLNHDTLDNRKANLRLCTPKQNCGHRRLRKDNKTGFKGVHFNTRNGLWTATIGNTIIDHFDDPVQAAKAYDAAALKEYGAEFAVLNFPPVSRSSEDKEK